MLLVGDGRTVDVHRHLPAEGLVKTVVFGGGGQILVSSHHMGDPHQMVVHHVGEVVGGVSVGFNEDHIVQLRVIHTDIAVNVVVEGGGPLLGVILTDHEGHSGLQIGLHLFLGKAQAVLIIGHDLLSVDVLL